MSEIMERDLYHNWIAELKQKYQQQRKKAVVAVNGSLLQFYWTLREEISERGIDNRYGTQFYKQLSSDLNAQIPNVKGLSSTNLKYTKYFYELYSG
jgi:hypothetical protein